MKIINTLINKIKNLDKQVLKLMHNGFIFSFILFIVSGLTLFTYKMFYSLPDLFYSGIALLRTSLMFACTFFIFGIGFDTIKKEMI